MNFTVNEGKVMCNTYLMLLFLYLEKQVYVY